MILAHRLFQGFHRIVDRIVFLIDLGAGAPDHHDAGEIMLFLEISDIPLELVGQIHLVLAALDVGAMQAFDIIVAKDRLHRLDRLQLGTDLFDIFGSENAGRKRRIVGAVGENIPGRKDDIIQIGEGDKILDFREAVVRALAEADGAHLGERSDRLGQSLAHQFHSGYDRGRNCAQTDEHNTEFPLSFLYRYSFFHDLVTPSSCWFAYSCGISGGRLFHLAAFSDLQI